MSKIGQFEINWCFLSTKNEKFSFVENQPMKVLSVAASQLDCKTVRIFAYSSTREQSNKRSGTRLNLRACETRALRAPKTLTPRFTDFFTDFEKKTDCFAVYLSALYINSDNSDVRTKKLAKRKECYHASSPFFCLTNKATGSKSLTI